MLLISVLLLADVVLRLHCDAKIYFISSSSKSGHTASILRFEETLSLHLLATGGKYLCNVYFFCALLFTSSVTVLLTQFSQFCVVSCL